MATTVAARASPFAPLEANYGPPRARNAEATLACGPRLASAAANRVSGNDTEAAAWATPPMSTLPLVFPMDMDDDSPAQCQCAPGAGAARCGGQFRMASYPQCISGAVECQLARDVELLQPNGCDATLLAERLRVLGYDAMVRATRGGLTPQPSGGGRPAASGRVFGSLRHEFVVVVVSEAPPLGMSRMGLGAAAGAAAARLRKAATAELSREIVVDVRFREQFEVPKPTAAYAALLARAPRVFVGSLFALLQAGMELAAGLEASFAEAGLPLPPWRRRDVLLSKWASAAAVGTAGGRSAPGTPWRSGDWAVAADAAAAGAPAAGLPHAPDMVRALSWSPPQVSAPEAGTRVAAAVPRTIKVGFPE